MVQTQYSLSWQAYQDNICSGFSFLQQNGEFVDMSLAADGHLVKVHQMLIALASPYLKEIIQSAPCPHPIIFLNNISHRILCNLLEYIYTGEALVPADSIGSFFEAAKALHIKGLEDMAVDGGILFESNQKRRAEADLCPMSGIKRVRISTGDHTQQISLPTSAKKIHIKRDAPDNKKDIDEYSDTEALDDNLHDNDNDISMIPESPQTKHKDAINETVSSNIQFTVSNRGSLQVILNRYMYNVHSTSRRSGVKRWRCVDYRNKRCQAFLVTNDNVVLSRSNLHNHPFHDKKILGKIEKQAIYSTLDDVEKNKDTNAEKDFDGEETIETQDYIKLDTLIEKLKDTDTDN